MSVTPWALMLADPTTSVMAVWLDEREGATDDPQTAVYGPEEVEAISSVVELPGGGRFIHSAVFTGLEPGSLCAWGVPDESLTFKPIKILPKRVPIGGITGMVVSDMHCGKRDIDEPSKFEFCGDERPDFVLIPGDSSAHVGEGGLNLTESSSALHSATFRDYLQQWHGDFIPQMLADCGNHWVGNSASNGENAEGNAGTGTSDTRLGAEFYEWFHPNVALVPPLDDPLEQAYVQTCRHLVVNIGNWLQVISGDVFSNTHQSARAAFLEAHNPDAGLCVWMSHSPMFSRTTRLSSDPTLHGRMRGSFFKQLAERENCPVCFGGNIHADSATLPLSVYESDPGGGLQFSGADSGWIAPAPAGEWKTITEFGQGMLGFRATLASPVVPLNFFRYYEQDPFNYYLMHFSPGQVVVEDKDETGSRDEVIFRMPFAERDGGTVARAYNATGKPIYPRRIP